MITHTEITYETADGLIFKDEDEAYRHENMLTYKKSGFRFYRKDRRIIKDVDRCYDEGEYFTIDHSKEAENAEFIEMAQYYFGWPFPDDILEKKEIKRYRYDWKNFCWKPVSKRKASGIKEDI